MGEIPTNLEAAAAARPADGASETGGEDASPTFATFANCYQPGPNDSGLDAALDALLLTEAVPRVSELISFVERHGVGLGDNHFSTARTQWLPLLDAAEDRALLVEADADGRVESVAVVRAERWTRVS